jgi:hypothetical protein
MPKWLIVIAIVCLLYNLAPRIVMYNHHISFIPKGMNVDSMVYYKEESWGWGPGGNEAGAISYSLPDSEAEKIEKLGIDYFKNLQQPVMKSNDDWHGRYDNWHDTPIDEKWVYNKVSLERLDSQNVSGIRVYLYNMGFMIDKNIEDDINKAITETGNYYAYGRIGIIIVAPKMRRVFYVYSS